MVVREKTLGQIFLGMIGFSMGVGSLLLFFR